MLATTIHKSNTTPHHQSGATTRTHPHRGPISPPVPHRGPRGDGPVVSKPNSVSGKLVVDPRPPERKATRGPTRLLCTRTTPTTGVAHPSNRPAHRTPAHCGRVW